VGGTSVDGDAPGWPRAIRTLSTPAIELKWIGAVSVAASPSIPFRHRPVGLDLEDAAAPAVEIDAVAAAGRRSRRGRSRRC
jgi:hypothetical protein